MEYRIECALGNGPEEVAKNATTLLNEITQNGWALAQFVPGSGPQACLYLVFIKEERKRVEPIRRPE